MCFLRQELTRLLAKQHFPWPSLEQLILQCCSLLSYSLLCKVLCEFDFCEHPCFMMLCWRSFDLISDFSVIAPEAKNILLRHFYQHAEEKVSIYRNILLHLLNSCRVERPFFQCIYDFIISSCSWQPRELRLIIRHQSAHPSSPGLLLLIMSNELHKNSEYISPCRRQ